MTCGSWEGSDWTKKQCLFNEDFFFAALEVNYPALMSPLTMIPAYMPISTLQREFQGLLKEVSAKIGSLSTNAESLEVEKAIFKQPMILISEPSAMPLSSTRRHHHRLDHDPHPRAGCLPRDPARTPWCLHVCSRRAARSSVGAA